MRADFIFSFVATATDYRNENHRLYWEEPKEVNGKKIEFSGVPFYIMGSKIYDCQHGKDRNSSSNTGKYTTGQMTV